MRSQMWRPWTTSKGTGKFSCWEEKEYVLPQGGCFGESTVARLPTLVAMTGTPANMRGSYSRCILVFDIQDLQVFLFSLIKTFAGQRAVDQQCDILRRKARQVRHEHHRHHRQCVHACSGGALYFKNLWQSSQTLPTCPLVHFQRSVSFTSDAGDAIAFAAL